MNVTPEERHVWADMYAVHEKYHDMPLEPDNFPQLTNEVAALVVKNGNSRLAIRLGTAIINYFEDLYQIRIAEAGK